MANTDQRGDEYIIVMDPANPARQLKVNADGSINAISSGTAPNATVSGTIAANTQAVVAPVAGYATWSFAITNSGGAWVGTIAFQGSVDGGATYPLNISAHVMGNTINSTAQSTTANGQWDGGAAPLTHVRAIATAWTSGTAAITINLSQAPLFATMVSALPQGTNTLGGIIPVAPALTSTTFTIANGASISDVQDIGGNGLTRLIMPAVWTAAALTMQSSPDNVTYNDVYDASGNEYTIQAAANRAILIDPSQFTGMRYIKLRSGTGALPVAQGAQRLIVAISRPF